MQSFFRHQRGSLCHASPLFIRPVHHQQRAFSARAGWSHHHTNRVVFRRVDIRSRIASAGFPCMKFHCHPPRSFRSPSVNGTSAYVDQLKKKSRLWRPSKVDASSNSVPLPARCSFWRTGSFRTTINQCRLFFTRWSWNKKSLSIPVVSRC